MFWIRVSILLFAATASRTVWDGVYTKQQAARGEAMYLEECARCHGQNLLGGEAAPPVAGADFLKGWSGKSAGELFEMVRKTMPEDNPGALSARQSADVIAYLFSANKFPAGDTELQREPEALKEIRIEPQH